MNQQADVVVTFLKTHPNELQANAPRLIEKSLQEKYPCTTEIKK